MKKIIFLLLMAFQAIMSQAQDKLVALSFDDGPNTTTTVHMLDVLKKHQVKASFFVIGKNITPKSAKIMVRAHKEGHDIENHSLTHSPMSQLSADSILGFICGENCEDWEPTVTAEERVSRMLKSAKDGLIFLLHDFEGNEATVEAVDQIIPILKQRGFRFVTVRELFKKKGIKAQKNLIYTDVAHPNHIIK